MVFAIMICVGALLTGFGLAGDGGVMVIGIILLGIGLIGGISVKSDSIESQRYIKRQREIDKYYWGCYHDHDDD